MGFSQLPPFAAWRHCGAREGFEVVFPRAVGDGYVFEGQTTAVEAGEAWAVEYAISIDRNWVTRSARVMGRSGSGRRELTVEAEGEGAWRIDGAATSGLDGCVDVDLESSSLTNAFPVHRLALEVGQTAEAPAAYIRALDLSVERLEQRYRRIEDEGQRQRFDY